ncbi:asparaginase-domain-containing protein [Ascodesmis nigricans]|uniref:asparaginase n=1 Tax=Ascodesmis nigricans TaxID=341454 RepID=A0A4S2N176_9PEZI|nr:asparaginase-domain-containing protein [Ascodesmis nigricans]
MALQAKGFLDKGLRPRPVFNDGSPPKTVSVVGNDGEIIDSPSLRTPLSKYSRRIRYTALEFDPLLDSSSMNAKGWEKIAKAIQRNYQLFDAFVILHGTDSLAYTASALSFMINNLGKPVILTGSQAPMSELHNDATDNLLGSMIIGGHYMVPEVCLFFNHRLLRGNRSTKVNALDFAAFASPNCPDLATIGISVNVNWNQVRRPNSISPFSIQTNLSTSHVACLRIFPGIMPQMLRGVLKLPGLKGLILETFGSGNAPQDDELIEVLREGIESGIVVVSVTQCQIGSVSPLYAAGTTLARAGVIFGLDMTSEAALTKLASLLSQPSLSTQDVRALMSQSIRGELTEVTENIFSHPQETPSVPPLISTLSTLGYAIASKNHDAISQIIRESGSGSNPSSPGMEASNGSDNMSNITNSPNGFTHSGVIGGAGFLLNQFDYSGNTPLHIAAGSDDVQILRMFLELGASVHLRNRDGKTPLFIAAKNGRVENVRLLKASGAHLHADEKDMARLLKKRSLMVRDGGCRERVEGWELAGA